MIDLDALEASIADGERRNLFVAPLVKDLIAELREARGERAAVVAFVLEHLNQLINKIEESDDRVYRNTASATSWLLMKLAGDVRDGIHRRGGDA